MTDHYFKRNNTKHTGLCGLVLCGGSSIRMGKDKGSLRYHDKPQVQQVHEMLNIFCEKVYISCKPEQTAAVPNGYEILADLPQYREIGPMAALLTAFTHFPEGRFLLIGCDYPFVTAEDIEEFLSVAGFATPAASFYNVQCKIYEPMLALYNSMSAKLLFDMHIRGEHSLQHFLRTTHALKFYPVNLKSTVSVDTEKDFLEAVKFINRLKKG